VEWRGDDTQIVDFVGVSKYANVKEGDLVHTYSHYFPGKAVIGTIESVKLADSGTSFDCKIRLAADMGRLFNVVLVHNKSVSELKALEAEHKD
jgi:cell shape-determining protein MreC